MKKTTLSIITLSVILLFMLTSCIKEKEPPRKQPPRVCIEKWECGPWSLCTNNIQRRTCIDMNNCNTQKQKPSLSQPCGQPRQVCGDKICNNQETCQTCPGDCGQCPPKPVSNDIPLKVTLGTEEVAYDWTTDKCEDLDLPDVYAHAIRNYKNEIILVSGNAPKNYFMFGPNFKSLKRNCKPFLISGDKWDLTAYDHQEWITSVYTEDGKTIHALVHNEYHDPHSPTCKPGNTQPSNPCWYNFISSAFSTDGGYTFTQLSSPDHLVAFPPHKWDPDVMTTIGKSGPPGPYGYMEPSNIIKGKDGYYYNMFFAILSPTNKAQTGVCIMRTNNIADPSSWKLWNGFDFAIPLTNPYATQITNPDQHLCSPVSHWTIPNLRGSLTYNTYLDKYMLVGVGAYHENNQLICGFWFSLSDDLLNWGKPKLLKEAALGWPPCEEIPGSKQKGIYQEAYPSIIDHTSTDRSFTTTGQQFYIYFMRNNALKQGNYLDRDLIRIPVTIEKI